MAFPEKSDGVWFELHHYRQVLNAKHMPDGRCIVNDVHTLDGSDVRQWPTCERWQALQAKAATFPAHVEFSKTWQGGLFLRSITGGGPVPLGMKTRQNPAVQ